MLETIEGVVVSWVWRICYSGHSNCVFIVAHIVVSGLANFQFWFVFVWIGGRGLEFEYVCDYLATWKWRSPDMSLVCIFHFRLCLWVEVEWVWFDRVVLAWQDIEVLLGIVVVFWVTCCFEKCLMHVKMIGCSSSNHFLACKVCGILIFVHMCLSGAMVWIKWSFRFDFVVPLGGRVPICVTLFGM